jgi:hypothetical protein
MTRLANWITGGGALLTLLLWGAAAWDGGPGSGAIPGIEAETARLIAGQSDVASLVAHGALAVLLNAPVMLVFGDLGLPSALLLAAGLAALLIGRFAEMLTRAGHGPATVAGSALIAALNPLTLHTVASGPAAVLLACGCAWLAVCLIRLAGSGELTDIILTGLALAFPLLAHPAGVVVTAAALPFAVVCAPRLLLNRSVPGTFVALAFPAAFVVLSNAVLGWIFAASRTAGEDVRQILLRQTVAPWSEPAAATDLPLRLAESAGEALLMLPVCIIAAIALHPRRAARPLFALAAIPALAASLAAIIGWNATMMRWGGEPLPLLAPLVALSFAAIAMLARTGLPPATTIAALVLCMLGGVAGLPARPVTPADTTIRDIASRDIANRDIANKEGRTLHAHPRR